MTLAGCFSIVRYTDAPAALGWMATTLGLQEQFVVPVEPGEVRFAVMGLGDDIVATGSLKFGRRHTVAAYGDDVDSHYERSRDAGVEIVTALHDAPYGARIYSARDPQGHLWSFSSQEPPYKPPGVGQIVSIRGYDDAPSAVEWLVRAFGFEERLQTDGLSDQLVYAHLGVGEETVLCASLPAMQRIGHNPEGAPFILYAQVDDVDECWQRARMAGAEVVKTRQKDESSLCRFYVRDLEGCIWGVGERLDSTS